MYNESKLIEALEDEKLEKMLFEANKRFCEVLGNDEVELFEIIEEGVKSLTKPSMYISRAKIGKSEDIGYAIEFQNNEGDIVVDSAFRILKTDKDVEGVSVGMIEKIREMAYIGYVLRQGRDDSVKEVFK